MTDLTSKTKRPSSITLISVFEIMEGVLLFYFVLLPGVQSFVRNRGIWDTLFFLSNGMVLLVTGVGFWLMKKWAVYTFIVLAAVSQVYLILAGRWNVLSLLIWAIPIFIGYRHLSKMT